MLNTITNGLTVDKCFNHQVIIYRRRNKLNLNKFIVPIVMVLFATLKTINPGGDTHYSTPKKYFKINYRIPIVF